MTAGPRYSLSRAAANDLDAIFLHSLVQFGLQQAEHHLAKLLSILDIIADNPELGRLRTDISPHSRVHPHGPHILIYTLDECRRPQILRIRHALEAWIEPEPTSHNHEPDE